jgi:hypothetical protein
MIVPRGMKVFLVAVLSVALLSHLSTAQAKLVQWNLQDVTFDDGGRASGFFLLDTDELVDHYAPLHSYEIKVSGGKNGIPPFEYIPSDGCGYPAHYNGVFIMITAQVVPGHCGSLGFSLRRIELSGAALTNAGGPVSIALDEFYPTRQSRHLVEGILVELQCACGSNSLLPTRACECKPSTK